MNIKELIKMIKQNRPGFYCSASDFLNKIPKIKTTFTDYCEWGLDQEGVKVFSFISIEFYLDDLILINDKFELINDYNEAKTSIDIFEKNMQKSIECIAIYLINGGDIQNKDFMRQIEELGSIDRLYYSEVRKRFNTRVAA